jgi:predicted dehydrogenase
MIQGGELGEIRRVVWIITNWFRSDAYYASGGWRATWSGEGGGVLINQGPHNLDRITWFCGSPSRVTANIGLGKHHEIEVEDDVTALLEYPNGATGVFVPTTGDSPGTNRLEITGDGGKLVTDGRTIELIRTHQSVSAFSRTSEQSFANVPHDKMTVEVGGDSGGHQQVTEKFIQAVLKNDKSLLVAHALDGIRGLELGNAMLMSGLTGEPVDIPTPRAKFDKLIRDLAAHSTFQKPRPAKKAKVDMNSSF